MSFVPLRPAKLLAIALLSVPAWGLDPQLAITQFGHDVWTTSNGLPSDSIRSIAQTADGYLWFATSNGLARFDWRELHGIQRLGRAAPAAYAGNRHAAGAGWVLMDRGG